MLSRRRERGPSSWLVLMVVAALAGGACAGRKTPPPQTGAAAQPAAPPPAAAPVAPAPPVGAPLTMLSVAEARPYLLASIVIPSVDRSLTSGTVLVAHAVPLPVDPAGVKEMLLAQAGLPAQVGENLDTGSPVGAAVVALDPPGPGAKSGLVMAIPAKGREQATTVVAALGHVVSRRGVAVEVDNQQGGRGWIWQSGNVIVLSDSVDALGRGALSALAARGGAGGAAEDITAVLYPDAIARAHGTDVRTGLTRMLAEAQAAQAKAGAAAPPATPQAATPTPDSMAMLGDLAAYVADAQTVELGLAMDGVRGLLASVRMRPRPGTALEAMAREVHPFEIDRALMRGADVPSVVMASSYGPFFRDQLAKQRQRLAASKEKGAGAALDLFDTSVAAMAGSWSAVGRVKPGLSLQIVYPLKDAAAGAKLSTAMAKLDPAAARALWKSQVTGAGATTAAGKPIFDWTVKKETVGKLKALHYTVKLDLGDLPETGRGAMRSLLGGPAMEVYAAVAGARLVVTVGKDAKSRLVEVAEDRAAPARKAPPHAKSEAAAEAEAAEGGDLAQALVAAKGKDSFGYLDLAQVVSVGVALRGDPRATAALATPRAPVPLYTTFAPDGQGKVVTFGVTVPPAAFVGVGALLQGLGGATLPPPN
jgi:hypothetical protein